MDTVCSVCKTKGTNSNKLLYCDYKSCTKAIHDNCNVNPVLIDNMHKFLCDDHKDKLEELETAVVAEDSPVQPVKDNNVTKRRPLSTGGFNCVICKDEGSVSSAILVECIVCSKKSHDTCLLQFGELKITNGVTICHECKQADLLSKFIKQGSDNPKNPKTKNKSKDKTTSEDSDLNQKNPNDVRTAKSKNKKVVQKNIHFVPNSEDTNESLSSLEEKRYSHSTPEDLILNRSNRKEKTPLKKIVNPPARRSFLPKKLETSTVNSGKNGELQEQFVNFMAKASMAILPVVGESLLAWDSFYAAYNETKDYFSVCENMSRVQKALTNSEIKKIGGHSLHNLDNFEAALANIDRRISKKDSAMLDEANELRQIKKPRDEDFQGIIDLMDKVIDFGNLIDSSKDKNYLNNYDFLVEISLKFPNYIQNKFTRAIYDARNNGRTPNYRNLVWIIEKELPYVQINRDKKRIQENGRKKENSYKSSSKQPEEKNWMNHVSEESFSTEEQVFAQSGGFKEMSTELSCWKHKNAKHKFNNCKLLWALDGRVVRALALENGRCVICGMPKHEPCPAITKLHCQTEGCNENHHALYCEKRLGDRNKSSKNQVNMIQFYEELNCRKIENESSNEEFDEEFEELQNHYICSNIEQKINNHQYNLSERPQDVDKLSIKRSSESLLGCLVARLDNGKAAAFLIDSGSTLSLIDESIANELGLEGPNYPLKLNWTGGHQRVEKDSRLVAVRLNNMDNPEISKIIHFRTDKELKMGDQRLVVQEFEKYKHLEGLKLHGYDKIVGIIGIDNKFLFDEATTVKGANSNEPLGIKTPLGDYLVSCKFNAEIIYNDFLNNQHRTAGKSVFYNYSITSEEMEEYESIERTIIENMDTPDCTDDRMLYEDDIAQKILDNNVFKDKDTGHYYAPLLWKPEIDLDFESSESLAYKRFFLMEKILAEDFDECEQQIRNLLSKDYAVELTGDQILKQSNKSYYIPIFFIKPKNKRMRTIWDMAAKIQGKSINDYLLRGPNYYNDILKIQFQMCEYENLIKGDLCEMFHQVRIINEDTEALRFVFRFRGELHIKHFKMKVLPFGARCSPTIAQYVKNLVASSSDIENPMVSDLMINSTYVDDIVSSLRSKEEAAMALVELRKNFKTGGFDMCKINSNNSEVLNIAKELMEEGNIMDDKTFSEAKVERLLGYTLNFEADTLSVEVSTQKLPESVRTFVNLPSKRQVLQLLMSIYDPIGYFQFVTSDMKIFYKKLLDLNWDELIPETLKKEWIKCYQDVERISDVKIPRLYCDKDYDSIEMHAFGDAGIDILCGVIYARFLREGEQVGYKLIYAKTFIVPRKPQRTVPELELHMARNLTKMTSTVIENHRIKFDSIIYYTDSAAILEWIVNGAKKMTQYMQNRLKVIKNEDKNAVWRWIPTHHMPADLGTKNKSIQIGYNNSWFKPEILDKNLLNKQEIGVYTQFEAKKDFPKLIDFDRYNCLFKLIVNVQTLFKFFHWIKTVVPLLNKLGKIKKLRGRMFSRENLNIQINREMQLIRGPNFGFKRAVNFMIEQAQAEALGEFEVKTHPDLKKQIICLENGIIKIKNRLPENSERPFVIKRLNATWLPRGHPLTKMIILHYHEVNKHILIKNVVACLENKYFIKNILTEVKKVIKKKCIWCKRFKAQPENPLMGDLPDERLGVYELPFTFAMLDIAGPIQVKLTRFTTVKRYILVYTCLTTRAVILELVRDLTADATMLAINNAIYRVGAPVRIITDNGTNFIGARTRFRELAEVWNQKLIKKGCIIEPIEWKFGPARAPHFQGAVEIMVGLTKKVMKTFLQMMQTTLNKLDDLTVINMLTEIMGILNSRPLSMIPLDNGQHELLTPNSFLMRRPNAQYVPFRDDDKPYRIYDYSSVKESIKPLWEHWIKYYLPTISRRSKWNKMTKNLQIGDIVVTADTTVGNSWRLGTIIKINPGSKEQVRSVEVKLGKRETNIQYNNSYELKMQKYVNEKASIVTRPATAVARLDISQ